MLGYYNCCVQAIQLDQTGADLCRAARLCNLVGGRRGEHNLGTFDRVFWR